MLVVINQNYRKSGNAVRLQRTKGAQRKSQKAKAESTAEKGEFLLKHTLVSLTSFKRY